MKTSNKMKAMADLAAPVLRSGPWTWEEFKQVAIRLAVEQGERLAFADPQVVYAALRQAVRAAYEEHWPHVPDRARLSGVLEATIAACHTSFTGCSERGGYGLLYTFGYSRAGAEIVVEQLVKHQVTICDIRFSPRSRRHIWRKPYLEQQLREQRYCHLRELGNINYNQPGSEIELYKPEQGVSLVANFLRGGQHAALMCVCAEVEGCHRLVAARRVQEYLPGIVVVHL